ncbi:MAG: TetR/AcrR family transcriptional regulator [Myxococcota bacterium]
MGRSAKRDDVVTSALAEFLAKGYSGTTLANIAQRAEVSTATVFKHFRTKADVFGAIMERVLSGEDVFSVPDLAHGNVRENLHRIGMAYADSVAPDSIRALFRLVIAEVPRFPELGEELYKKGKRPYLDRLEGFLAARCEAGELAISDIPNAARQFLGMINDVTFWPYLLVENLPPADTAGVVASAVDTFLRAYRSRST